MSARRLRRWGRHLIPIPHPGHALAMDQAAADAQPATQPRAGLRRKRAADAQAADANNQAADAQAAATYGAALEKTQNISEIKEREEKREKREEIIVKI